MLELGDFVRLNYQHWYESFPDISFPDTLRSIELAERHNMIGVVVDHNVEMAVIKWNTNSDLAEYWARTQVFHNSKFVIKISPLERLAHAFID